MKDKKYWIVYANSNKCRHADALHKTGYVYWRERKNFKMHKGDIVYIFLNDERRVRFMTQVVAEHVDRNDYEYWIYDKITSDEKEKLKDPTYQLKFIEEYNGHELDEDKFYKYGYKKGGFETPNCHNTKLIDYIISVFSKKGYGYIIDEVVPAEKSKELVRAIIPILVRWAKQGLANKYYNDLIKELGYEKFSGIGKQLGYVDDVFQRFEELTGEHVPTLNALVKSPDTGLPSHGFSYVSPIYEKMSEDAKKTYVMGLNKEAFDYTKWDWVLSSLGLHPSIIDISDTINMIRSEKKHHYGKGGESENHKNLKNYIFNHPEVIGIENIKKSYTEYQLLSGDKLDVCFELTDGSRIAVEVKSIISDDDDILRGLFQCVKYRSILDAEDIVSSKKPDNSAILVIEGELNQKNKLVKETFGIKVKEKVEVV